jgi:ATP-dependent helicase HepA
MRNEAVKRKFLPAMLEQTRALGTEKSHAVIQAAMSLMRREMAAEIARLRDLAEVNDHIKPEEITALLELEAELASAIRNARVRLDAVRLIWKAPPAK